MREVTKIDSAGARRSPHVRSRSTHLADRPVDDPTRALSITCAGANIRTPSSRSRERFPQRAVQCVPPCTPMMMPIGPPLSRQASRSDATSDDDELARRLLTPPIVRPMTTPRWPDATRPQPAAAPRSGSATATASRAGRAKPSLRSSQRSSRRPSAGVAGRHGRDRRR